MTDKPFTPRSISASAFVSVPILPSTVIPAADAVVIPKSFCGKSSALVESLVIPNSGGLPPNGNTAKKNSGNTRKRPSPITVRFSEAEKEILRTKAKAAGCPVGTFIKAAALGSDYKPPANPELTSALLGLNRELTAQGNNLNQIARQLNGQVVTPDNADSMVHMLGRSMLRTHHAVRRALVQGKDGEP